MPLPAILGIAAGCLFGLIILICLCAFYFGRIHARTKYPAGRGGSASRSVNSSGYSSYPEQPLLEELCLLAVVGVITTTVVEVEVGGGAIIVVGEAEGVDVVVGEDAVVVAVIKMCKLY